MKPGDYEGWTTDTTDDAAVISFRVKHPEELGAMLEIHRDGACILVRRATNGQAHGMGDHGDVSNDGSRGGADVADAARSGVTDGL